MKSGRSLLKYLVLLSLLGTVLNVSAVRSARIELCEDDGACQIHDADQVLPCAQYEFPPEIKCRDLPAEPPESAEPARRLLPSWYLSVGASGDFETLGHGLLRNRFLPGFGRLGEVTAAVRSTSEFGAGALLAVNDLLTIDLGLNLGSAELSHSFLLEGVDGADFVTAVGDTEVDLVGGHLSARFYPFGATRFRPWLSAGARGLALRGGEAEIRVGDETARLDDLPTSSSFDATVGAGLDWQIDRRFALTLGGDYGFGDQGWRIAISLVIGVRDIEAIEFEPLPLFEIDLDVDSDRDGTVERVADDLLEKQFSRWRGAALLVNVDDDDQDGQSDAGNQVIDAGDVDSEPSCEGGDITPLDIHYRPSQFLFQDPEIALRIRQDLAQYVRIFARCETGETEVLGKSVGVFRGGFKEFVIPPAVLAGGATLNYGIEATQYARNDSSPVAGFIDLQLVARNPGSELVLAQDDVRFKLSPWLMLSHLADNQEVLVVDDSAFKNIAFRAELKSLLAQAGVTLDESVTSGDVWMQDEHEIGFSSSPTAQLHAILDGPRGRELDGTLDKLRGPGIGSFAPFGNLTTNTFNSFGNLEVTPPLEDPDGKDWILGRIYYGGSDNRGRMDPAVIDFLKAQRVQKPLEVDTTWLHVGHVDEVTSFIPDPSGGEPFIVLLASPLRALELLRAEQVAGRGADVLCPAINTLTIDQLLETEFDDYGIDITWQQNMVAVKDKMRDEFGITDPAGFLEVPVLFWKESAGARAWEVTAYFPNMVNLLVANGHLIIPEPCVEVFKSDLKSNLTSLGYQSSTVHFIDTIVAPWFYHGGEGELHCGTNSRREIPTVQWWTQNLD